MADTAYKPTEETVELPANFRKLSAREKRIVLDELLELDLHELHCSNPSEELLDLADVMVESSIGVMPVPLGVATAFRIDDTLYNIPMAVEEPSVVAAATYAGQMISRNGGFFTRSSGPVMTAQIAIDGADPGAVDRIHAEERTLHAELRDILGPMTRRGGGYRGIETAVLEKAGLLVVYLHVDVRDAMGANIINTAAEALRKPLEKITSGSVLMAILTNASPKRVTSARFHLPLQRLARDRFTGEEMAYRIVRGNEFADCDPLRAVTHNKGIMNGITSLALATGNDTRALEAAAHAYAVRQGSYKALTEYRIENEELVGYLELPMAIGTVGGAVGFHPVTGFALKILFMNDESGAGADKLSRIAVSLGLAQNMAALMALVGEGIQRGHMRRHARRIAYKVGARDQMIQELAERVWKNGHFNIETARELFTELKRERKV